MISRVYYKKKENFSLRNSRPKSILLQKFFVKSKQKSRNHTLACYIKCNYFFYPMGSLLVLDLAGNCFESWKSVSRFQVEKSRSAGSTCAARRYTQLNLMALPEAHCLTAGRVLNDARLSNERSSSSKGESARRGRKAEEWKEEANGETASRKFEISLSRRRRNESGAGLS